MGWVWSEALSETCTGFWCDKRLRSENWAGLVGKVGYNPNKYPAMVLWLLWGDTEWHNQESSQRLVSLVSNISCLRRSAQSWQTSQHEMFCHDIWNDVSWLKHCSLTTFYDDGGLHVLISRQEWWVHCSTASACCCWRAWQKYGSSTGCHVPWSNREECKQVVHSR